MACYSLFNIISQQFILFLCAALAFREMPLVWKMEDHWLLYTKCDVIKT
jgi:hypothetical protein